MKNPYSHSGNPGTSSSLKLTYFSVYQQLDINAFNNMGIIVMKHFFSIQFALFFKKGFNSQLYLHWKVTLSVDCSGEIENYTSHFLQHHYLIPFKIQCDLRKVKPLQMSLALMKT